MSKNSNHRQNRTNTKSLTTAVFMVSPPSFINRVLKEETKTQMDIIERERTEIDSTQIAKADGNSR